MLLLLHVIKYYVTYNIYIYIYIYIYLYIYTHVETELWEGSLGLGPSYGH